ncbi:MAG: GNAT family N-acetyltransferase [Candidatus Thorarchaeota archaeon]
MSIRQAKSTDAEQISRLYKDVWNEYTEEFPDELRISRQPSPEEMKTWLGRETYFVAVDDDEIVGVVGCILEHGACLLTHMAIEKDHRRQGIGTALTNTVIQYAKSNDAFKVWLDTVPVLKEAVSLYKKLGFVKCGHLRQHFWGADVELYELVLT